MGIFSSLLGSSKPKNPDDQPFSSEEIYESAKLELQDILAPAALKVQMKNLQIGGLFSRSYFAISYPRFLSSGWMSPIINLDKVFDIAIHIEPIDTEKVLRRFQKKVAEVQSQMGVNDEQGKVRNPELDMAYQDLEDLRDRLQQASEKIFEVGLYITIYAETEDELAKVENEMKTMFESRLIYIKPALYQQEQGFRSSMPVAKDEILERHKINSGPLSSFYPFVSSDLTSNEGILYGVNRHNSSLVIFDRFSLENYNSVIFAKSGSGKSYTTKLEVLRTLMFDTEVIVIDPEREYEYLAEAVGGRYFNLSLSSEHHINPFDLPIALKDESPDDVLRTHIIHLVGLFRILLGGLTPEEDSIIDRAVTETYGLKDITMGSDYRNSEPPLMSDFEMVLDSMEGSESLMHRLKKYTQGSWAGFINHPSNVDINKKLVVFSIRDMEDDLKPAAMYIVTNFIWSAIRKNIRKRLLVVDEAWIMMKTEDTASFLFGLAKRGRKYYLGLATITQDVGDFMKSKYGIPIITNSSLQLLLKQSPSTIDNVQQVFNLTDEEKYLLLESGVGEGIFFAGLKHVAIKVIASYTEDQIITSDPSQLIAIDQAKQDFANNAPTGTVN